MSTEIAGRICARWCALMQMVSLRPGILLLVFLAGCAAENNVNMNPQNDPEASASAEERLEARQRAQNRLPESVPDEVAAAVTGEVPDAILSQVKADLTKRIGVPAEELEIIVAEAVVWPDGSLGCPKPDQTYTQATVAGYQIVLRHADKQHDYRASESGYFFLCEKPLPTRPERKPTR